MRIPKRAEPRPECAAILEEKKLVGIEGSRGGVGGAGGRANSRAIKLENLGNAGGGCPVRRNSESPEFSELVIVVPPGTTGVSGAALCCEVTNAPAVLTPIPKKGFVELAAASDQESGSMIAGIHRIPIPIQHDICIDKSSFHCG
ncbi:hypothetical protein NL676_029078 [Syzygium grande]|nr:hypothetical protein NL676_029078 [Syzygium grande]